MILVRTELARSGSRWQMMMAMTETAAEEEEQTGGLESVDYVLSVLRCESRSKSAGLWSVWVACISRRLPASSFLRLCKNTQHPNENHNPHRETHSGITYSRKRFTVLRESLKLSSPVCRMHTAVCSSTVYSTVYCLIWQS